MITITTEGLVLEVTDCCSCGVEFAMPARLLRERRENGGGFYCPNGHRLVYKTPTTERLKKKLESAEARARHEADQREAAERSNAALRGANTKLRNRAAAGVCPCCHRSFQNVARHMSGQHPQFVAEVSA